ncbi:MAG: NAD(P)-dependent alcohol dehydrogenase, partial [Pricia sp.]|nr:NAD(P)-dependent alcohol dehydrogenase [Pricia sp.]
MKAAIRRKYGSHEVVTVEELEQPVPKENEVLIRVHGTTVNRTDCANLTAKPFIMRFLLGIFSPKRIVLGTDFAGVVVQTGKAVKNFKQGDGVFGFNDMGLASQAEYLTLPENGNLMTIPEGIGYDIAAASIEGAHYAYTFLKKSMIESGDKVLINGATGAIGSSLLQFVKQSGATITATCNTKNIKLIESLGASKVYDYTREDFLNDTEHYDFVFDAVGKSTFKKCSRLLKKKGVYISSELGPNAQNVYFALITPWLGGQKVVFPIPFSPQETLPFIKKNLEQASFKPIIDKVYALDEIAKAYEYVL